MPGPSRNYVKELERLIQKLQQEGKVPRLLLHACCAPCSSAVLEYLSQYFAITLLYYNPNIAPLEEYQKREAELRRLVSQMKFTHLSNCFPASTTDKPLSRRHGAWRGSPREASAASLLPAAAALCRPGGRPPALRLLHHHPVHLPHEKRPSAKPAGGGDWQGVRRGPPASDFKKKGRLQALRTAFQGVRFVPPGLLRLRLFQGPASAGKEEREEI